MAQPSGERSGAKTPRKNVQWAASTKGEGPMPLLLDEEGLDVSPLSYFCFTSVIFLLRGWLRYSGSRGSAIRSMAALAPEPPCPLMPYA